MAIFVRACIFIFFAAIAALAQTAPEHKRRAVLLDLASWSEEHTNALVSADTNSDVKEAVDAFLSQNVSIQINGASVKRSDFVKSLEAALPRRISCNATYSSIIEVPTDPTSPITAGWVGAFFEINSAYPNKTQTQSISDNILIEQDPSIPIPSPVGGIRGDFDGRRVMSINRVTTVV